MGDVVLVLERHGWGDVLLSGGSLFGGIGCGNGGFPRGEGGCALVLLGEEE